jgi:hypothetical protein
MPESDPIPAPPTIPLAIHAVEQFLLAAADRRDPQAAKEWMTDESIQVPMFDPAGLAGMKYSLGEPMVDEDAVIIPVVFGNETGQQGGMPFIVVMENGFARLDVISMVEMMMGGEVTFVEPDDPRLNKE